MTSIKLKAVNPDYSFITRGKVYSVEEIDKDGDYVIYDDDGDTYFVHPYEIGEGNEWEKLTGFDFYDLRNGDIVVTRNGRKYAFMKNLAGRGDVFANLEFDGKEAVANYNEALLNTNNHDWDVMEVYRCDLVSTWHNWNTLEDYTCVFKREDRKRMTVEEIEAQLGYKIEVVDNE